ncbi:MAG: acyl-CoA/acyl-ACP dehydrogenase [Dehalococcoidales bacterium]|nr:acyl-CoA/acyl-ACP dehydrogenase [Dehalococcoidales bacterium]
MDAYPWWNEAQKKLAKDAKKVADEILIPMAERDAWKKEYPWDAVKVMAEQGWFGAQIPAKYGGRAEEWGVTGAAIILEEAARGGELSLPLGPTMFGGVHQILHDGTEEQRQRLLPPIAKGQKMGAITMTEPYAGSDIAAIETLAKRDGDHYIINGKKRFQTNMAAADVYMTYVKTSEDPADRAKYRHLTAIVIEKGMPGFSVEKINEIMSYDGGYNGYLSFDNCKVPAANRLGEEGDGWRIMMSGLNVERILNAAPSLGIIREAIRYANQHMNRRVQFNAPIGDIATNQFKMADMIWKLKMARLMTYYAAYCCDLGIDVPIEAAISKMFTTDEGMWIASEAIQVMGGNGAMRFYPVERIMRDAKVGQIAAGTSEVLRLLIYRMGTKELRDDLKAPRRVIDPNLKVPMPANKSLPRIKASSEKDVQAVLAENYRINPGLHMTMDDLKEELEISDTDLGNYLLALEKTGAANLYRDKRGTVLMARITLTGLSSTHSPEYYRYFPSWVNKKDIF